MKKIYLTILLCLVSACDDNRPTPDDCNKFSEHFVVLFSTKKNVGNENEMKAALVHECLDKGTKREIDCALRASKLEDLENCGQPRKR